MVGVAGGGGGRRVKKLVIFWGRHKWMTPTDPSYCAKYFYIHSHALILQLPLYCVFCGEIFRKKLVFSSICRLVFRVQEKNHNGSCACYLMVYVILEWLMLETLPILNKPSALHIARIHFS